MDWLEKLKYNSIDKKERNIEDWKQTYGQARITELKLYRHKIKKDRRLKRYDGENRK